MKKLMLYSIVFALGFAIAAFTPLQVAYDMGLSHGAEHACFVASEIQVGKDNYNFTNDCFNKALQDFTKDRK